MSYTKKELLEWCLDQDAQGHSLALGWDGGGDSGYVSWHGDSEENDYTDALIDLCYDELDYGSWAGEFSANGEAIFDSKENAFIGTDNYSEESYIDINASIKIKVPKHLQFDVFHYEIDCPYEEGATVHVTLSIKNGFKLPEEEILIEKLQTNLEEQVDQLIADYSDSNEAEGIRCYETEMIDREEFTEEGDYLVYTLTSLNVSIDKYDPRQVFIDLNDQE